MALISSRSAGHPPPAMPDYDDICEDYQDQDYTYDELTDAMSTCSGSVNDILDHLNDEELRDSGDLDNLDLDDMTIPDVINIPVVNGSARYQAGYSNGRHHVSANHKTVSNGGKNLLETSDTGDTGAMLLSEYMDKVTQRSDRDKDQKLVVTEPRKFLELADRSSSRDNCILSEFMLMRDAKFSKVTTDNNSNDNQRRVNSNDGMGRLSQQSLSNNRRLSNSSSTNSIRTLNSAYNGSLGSTVSSVNRNKSCPSPSFDARNLKNAKWSSTEDITVRDNSGTFKDLPSTWTPRNQPSPSSDRRDFKPVNFESNSLKKTRRSASSESPGHKIPPVGDSFAWKDNTLDKDLRAIKDKKFSDAPEPKHRDGRTDGLDKSLQNWANTPLPKPEDPDVILLKKARQEKKVKRYLEDNFRNREGNFTPEPDSKDLDIGSLSSKYSLDRRREDERNSPPKSPPPFSKAESRFEREQRIKVGSLDSFSPGATLERERSLSPAGTSAAQQRSDRERFRVEPGRIENYTIGRGSLAQQESYKADLAKSSSGGLEACGITKYSASHSFNPLLLSKSTQNLSVKKATPSEGKNLQRAIKDGYESDSTLSYRRHNYVPLQNSSSESKNLYTQVQKGGEVPIQGLRMQAPDKKDYSRPGSSLSGSWRRGGVAGEQQTEEEIRMRQKQQLNQFYQNIDQHKENQLRVDLESRKHHDTLLPNQKSPVPLNRYEEQDTNGNQAVFLNAGKKPDDCKMVAKALFSFQAQNNRELAFRKGDVIYIKKQVDNNWFEGERNAAIGIFPVSYVEILPTNTDVSTLTKKEKNYEGGAKAKFNFTAQTPMELSLIKGEAVTLTRRIDKNWYEGKIGSRKGILPVSYVDVSAEPGEAPSNGSGSLPKPAAAPAAHSILKNGALPQSSYIPMYDKPKSFAGSASPYSTLSRPGSSMSNGKPEPTPYRALYNYKPQNEDEVELLEGDIVYVMEKCDDGWFVGTSQRTGIFGTFPGNYVTQV